MNTSTDERATLAELTENQLATLKAIRSLRGACTARQVSDITGRDSSGDLQRLAARGLVKAEGRTRGRRYTAVGVRASAGYKPGELSSETARQENDGVLRVKVLDLLRRDPTTKTVGRLAQVTLREPDAIETAVRQLMNDGRVVQTDDGSLDAISRAEERARRRARVLR